MALRQSKLKWQRMSRSERKKRGLCEDCADIPERGRRCEKCRIKSNERTNASNQRMRISTFGIYGGPRCKCCGETEMKFLTLDHIDGGGRKHRASLNRGGGVGFYKALEKLGYPPGFQVLCYNCNQAKGQYGKCPHQEDSDPKGG